MSNDKGWADLVCRINAFDRLSFKYSIIDVRIYLLIRMLRPYINSHVYIKSCSIPRKPIRRENIAKNYQRLILFNKIILAANPMYSVFRFEQRNTFFWVKTSFCILQNIHTSFNTIEGVSISLHHHFWSNFKGKTL